MIATVEQVEPSPSTVRSARSDFIVASLEGVNKNYDNIKALRDVDFRVCAGEVVALLGPNGAGKTTAVKLLLGLLQPNSGKVRVLGGDPTNPQNRMRTGAMLQVGRVPETLRVREHIDLFSSYYAKPMPLAEVLSAAGLEKISDRKFGDLSGGQKQRVLFALAICGDPDLIFLDEPTVGLDVEARRLLWDEIRHMVQRGKTVLLTICRKPMRWLTGLRLSIKVKSLRRVLPPRSRPKPAASGFVASRVLAPTACVSCRE